LSTPSPRREVTVDDKDYKRLLESPERYLMMPGDDEETPGGAAEVSHDAGDGDGYKCSLRRSTLTRHEARL
jgi:hypothetical protein